MFGRLVHAEVLVIAIRCRRALWSLVVVLSVACSGNGGASSSRAPDATPPSAAEVLSGKDESPRSPGAKRMAVASARGTTIDKPSAQMGERGEPGEHSEAGERSDPAQCTEALAAARRELDDCRRCHVAGGVAGDSAWLLTRDPADDLERLRAGLQELGDELLATAAELDDRSHGGGELIPFGSQAYQRLSEALKAAATPAPCAALDTTSEAGVDPTPLLGSSHGGHAWSRFCETVPDSAPLPVDPRTLVQPGTNAGAAVHFNAPWVECENSAPRTCGEYRAGLERGREMMEGGRLWFFGGDHVDAALTISALDYNEMWREWGLQARPDNYDELIAERWGVPLGEARNPYPLVGEDPNQTNGGSGQLPLALTQLRDEQGNYLSSVSFNCHWCHSGQVGAAEDGNGLGNLYGSGNPLLDVSAGFGEFMGGATALLPVAANKVRGSGDILLYPAIAALDVDRPQHYNESLVAAPSQGSVDYPVWWNLGHRTRRFHDGSFAMDDARPVMGFFMPIVTLSGPGDVLGGRDWITQRDRDVQLWLESLTAPAYPGPIDHELAEAGAILFHNKDLWADTVNDARPRPPEGNGSCASCHGVYAPRYAQEPRYLEHPSLQGVAAYVVPLSIIDTDPARALSLTDRLAQTLSYSWWGYGTPDEPGACFGVAADMGYLAPPLYGIWASAPYFHNGSVPDVWGVLDPSDRPDVWRRHSKPAPMNTLGLVMGFDTDLSRAYDHDRLGWRHEILPCGDPLLQPALDCRTADPEQDPAAQALAAGTFGDAWFTWNLAPQPRDADTLEQRKIYNTHHYSQSHRGHAFTAVLTDLERRALIEYLKTL